MKALYVLDNPKMAQRLDTTGFSLNPDESYKLDRLLVDELEINGEPLDCFTVDDEQPEHYRPVAIHVVPYTVVDGERYYFLFDAPSAPTVYVSFKITPDDFIAPEGEQMMSLGKTLIGKVIKIFDQPHIDLKLSLDKFTFPAVLHGEFVWTLELQGDNNFVVDELAKQLGTVHGRIAHADALKDASALNTLSTAIVTYKKDDIDVA